MWKLVKSVSKKSVVLDMEWNRERSSTSRADDVLGTHYVAEDFQYHAALSPTAQQPSTSYQHAAGVRTHTHTHTHTHLAALYPGLPG